MKDSNFYAVLGVPKNVSDAELRKAYRKLVLELHPDRNPDPSAKDRFIQVTHAYEVLSDKHRRAEYDRIQDLDVQVQNIRRQPSDSRATTHSRAATGPRPNPGGPPKSQPKTAPRDQGMPRGAIAEDLLKLSTLMNKARFSEAERLAMKLRVLAPKEPLPYAVLGDLARMRGKIQSAVEFYAYAAQFDPKSTIYMRKHEEALRMLQEPRSVMTADAPPMTSGPIVVAGLIVLVAASYVALSNEPPILSFPLLSSFTIGLIVMLIVAGAAIGAGLSMGGYLERLNAGFGSSTMSIPPGLAVGMLAIVNFWVALLVYFGVSVSQDTVNPSLSRLLLSIVAGTVLLTIASLATGRIEAHQTLIWGGNFMYVGALMGWGMADAVHDTA